MTAPEPTTPTPPPAEDPQGSLGAVLIGGAILVVAALLIFWPDGDSASRTDGADARGNAAVANSGGDGGGSGRGQAGGVAPRDHDPAEGKVNARINPALQMSNRTMAPSRPPAPEPTSFNSAAEEIAYFEKRLELARSHLASRATFLERMKKIKEDARTLADQTRAETRAALVQKNYDSALKAVTDLEEKLAKLREKQGAAG